MVVGALLTIGLESDDVTLVLKLGFSTRQDGRAVQIVRLPGPDTIKSSPHFRFPLGLEFLDRH